MARRRSHGCASQDWFTGRLGTIGASYLGYVQLALAEDPPPELKAAVVQVGISDPAAFVYPGGAFAFANVFSAVAATFSGQGLLRATRALVRLGLRWKRVSRVLPLRQAARQAFGEPVPYLEQYLDHEDLSDAYWREMAPDLSRWQVPTALQGGWWDGALDQTMAQYAALRANGCDVSLLIGPWSHSSAFTKDGLVRVSREALAWMTERLAGVGGTEGRAPVQVYVGGSAQWRDLEAWPPQEGTEAWYLNGNGELSREAEAGGGNRRSGMTPRTRHPRSAASCCPRKPDRGTTARWRHGPTYWCSPASRCRPRWTCWARSARPCTCGPAAATLTSSSGYATSIPKDGH